MLQRDLFKSKQRLIRVHTPLQAAISWFCLTGPNMYPQRQIGNSPPRAPKIANLGVIMINEFERSVSGSPQKPAEGGIHVRGSFAWLETQIYMIGVHFLTIGVYSISSANPIGEKSSYREQTLQEPHSKKKGAFTRANMGLGKTNIEIGN